MYEERREDTGQALVIGGVGTALGLGVAGLLARKPPNLAPLEEKLDYLIQLQEALVQSQAQIANLLQQILDKEIELEVSVLTPWVAKPEEQIFDQAIMAAGTLFSDKTVKWTEGKRLVFKVESSLNQAVSIQVIGNIFNDMSRATNINGAFPCPANGNITIGLAWDDWHPYVGIRITVAVAPTAGRLTIWAVIQE